MPRPESERRNVERVACYTERNQGLPAGAQGRKEVEARSTLLCLTEFLGTNEKVDKHVIFKGW
jgi:hypothetical protein